MHADARSVMHTPRPDLSRDTRPCTLTRYIPGACFPPCACACARADPLDCLCLCLCLCSFLCRLSGTSKPPSQPLPWPRVDNRNGSSNSKNCNSKRTSLPAGHDALHLPELAAARPHDAEGTPCEHPTALHLESPGTSKPKQPSRRESEVSNGESGERERGEMLVSVGEWQEAGGERRHARCAWLLVVVLCGCLSTQEWFPDSLWRLPLALPRPVLRVCSVI